MTDTCTELGLQMLSFSRTRWESEFPSEVKVKEGILEKGCYLDSQNEYELWKSASFCWGLRTSVKGAKTISDNIFSIQYSLSFPWLQSGPAVFHPNLISRSNLDMFAAVVMPLGEDEVLQVSLARYCSLNRWNLIRLDFFMDAYRCWWVEDPCGPQR